MNIQSIISERISEKYNVTPEFFKSLGYTVKAYPASDMSFETKRIDLSDDWSQEMLQKAAARVKNGLGLTVKNNPRDLTVELLIEEISINGSQKLAVLSRPMSMAEVFETDQIWIGQDSE